MKFPIVLLALIALGISASAQITSAENGLTVPASTNTVQLGGSLLQTTNIDLNGNNLHFKYGGNYIFSMLSNGNIGIGTNSPGGRLSFTNCDQTEEPMGITWYNTNNTAYAIHRTAGPWTAPNYQQLRLAWNPGIILDPGAGATKSYVDIQGDGLRVTSGKVGIGTTTPGNSLSIATTAANTSGLQFMNLNGTSPAITGSGKVLSLDNNGNVILVNEAATTWGLTGNNLTDPNTNFIGTTDAQPLVFRTNNLARARISANGNLLLNKTTDNLNVFQAYGDGTFTSPLDYGTSLSFGDDQYNRVLSIRTYGDGAGTNRFSVIGQNMPEAGSTYNVAKQGGGIYLDDRSTVLPIRFMYKQAGVSGPYYSSGISVNGNFLIKTATDNGNALQVNGSISATGFVIPTGAAAGKVLTSDASGNATWQVAAASTAGWGLGGIA